MNKYMNIFICFRRRSNQNRGSILSKLHVEAVAMEHVAVVGVEVVVVLQVVEVAEEEE